MIDPFKYLPVRNRAVEDDRVPVFLVHMITRDHTWEFFTQLERKCRIALEIYSRITIEVGKGKDFAVYLEYKSVVAKREAFFGAFFGNAVISEYFDIHLFMTLS